MGMAHRFEERFCVGSRFFLFAQHSHLQWKSDIILDLARTLQTFQINSILDLLLLHTR